MGFGLPWALAGLVAVAIPIIAHLLRRQKLPKQTLPTIAFLHRIHATRAARLRVVDMLLLVSRTLLIVALVLVAAAPYRVVQSSLLDRQHALAIVFDDSLSMAAIHEGKTLIERAADLSAKQVRRLPEGSEVSVVLSGRPPRVWVRRRAELEMVESALGEIEDRSTRGDALCGAVQTAVELLLESELADRRLLVLSDFTPGARAQECEWPVRGIRVAFETVSTPNPDNRRIAAVEVIGDRESPEGLRLDLQIVGSSTEAPQKIRLRQGGQETQRTSVRWTDEGGEAELSIPSGSSDAVVELQLDPDDVLPADNVRGVLLGSDTVHVLLVDGDPHPGLPKAGNRLPQSRAGRRPSHRPFVRRRDARRTRPVRERDHSLGRRRAGKRNPRRKVAASDSAVRGWWRQPLDHGRRSDQPSRIWQRASRASPGALHRDSHGGAAGVAAIRSAPGARPSTCARSHPHFGGFTRRGRDRTLQ